MVNLLQDENERLIEENKEMRESVSNESERQFIVVPREKPSQADLDNTTISELEDENEQLKNKVKDLTGKFKMNKCLNLIDY